LIYDGGIRNYDDLCRLCIHTRFPPSRFTGKERDNESGNDYFGARYYASSMGRWLSPDWSAKIMPVPYAKLDNPQSLNLYAYVLNNPLKTVDKDGHVDDPCKGRSDCTVKIDKERNQMTVTQTSEKTVHSIDKDGNDVVTATKSTNTATFSMNTGKFITATTQTTTATAVNGRLTDVKIGDTTTIDRQTAVTHMSPEVFNGASKMAHAGVDRLSDNWLLGKELSLDAGTIATCAGTAGIGCGAAIAGDGAITATLELDRAKEKRAEADQ
jgi:RHS repeat-associated protein